MMVTADEYELPLAVADTAKELARITNKGMSSIVSAVFRYENGQIAHSIYRRVSIEEKE